MARRCGQASPERHSVGVCKIWYRIWVDDRCPPETPPRALGLCWFAPAARSAFRLAPPPHIPYDPIDDPTLPAGARGPLFIFRKIHLYGETKKSTHGHTTQAPTTPGQALSRPKRPAHAAATPADRRPRPGRPSRVGYLPWTNPPTLHQPPYSNRPPLRLAAYPIPPTLQRPR